MPTKSDATAAHREHAVHFYAGDDDLLRVIGQWFAPMRRDDAVRVVIATAEHRSAIRLALAAGGVDVEGAEAAGRLVLVDASETLERLLVDGAPDDKAFDDHVGALIRRAASGGQEVHAFGEMVMLLWTAGNVVGAIQLEELWNRLTEDVRFSLLCAYPAAVGEDAQAAEEFAQMCELHGEVSGGAPVPAAFDVASRFGRTTRSPRLARRFVEGHLLTWHRDDLVPAANLVVTELVTNAVVHGRSDATVSLARAGDTVRLAVGDASQSIPVLRDADVTDATGRGLRVVARLACRWGHDVVSGGKIVWVELDREAARRCGTA